MKLDRNTTRPRRGKYALIKLREAKPFPSEGRDGDLYCVSQSAVDFGDTKDSDFFVIRLKDKYAAPALYAYAQAAQADDPQYADEVEKLARIAQAHPNKRKPD